MFLLVYFVCLNIDNCCCVIAYLVVACVLAYLQFDYLKSHEIEEKINKIKWCHTANGAKFLLSTNDKTIKSWKVLTADGA